MSANVKLDKAQDHTPQIAPNTFRSFLAFQASHHRNEVEVRKVSQISIIRGWGKLGGDERPVIHKNWERPPY
jgi:hypothetical protein